MSMPPTSIFLILAGSTFVAGQGATPCSDSAAVPEGVWAVFNTSATSMPAVCKGLAAGAVAHDICCDSPDVIKPFRGLSFEGIVRRNNNGTCAAVPEFGGMNWYSRCNADNTIEYGEDCDGQCNCNSTGTYPAGCFKQNDIGPLIFFIQTPGCACPGSTTMTTTVPECADVTVPPRGYWVAYQDSSAPPPANCLGHPNRMRVQDECCSAPGSTAFSQMPFEMLYKNSGNNTCILLKNFGKHMNAQCNADGTITFGEQCSSTCFCGSVASYGPGCYTATPIGSTPYFIKTTGCACSTATATTTKAPCQDTSVAPMGHWVFYDLSKATLPQGCNQPVRSKVPDECCAGPGSVAPYSGMSFEKIYTDNKNNPCAVVPAFGNRPWFGQCNSDGSVTYGEACTEQCTCKNIASYEPGCHVGLAFPNTFFLFNTTGCSCAAQTSLSPATSQAAMPTTTAASPTTTGMVAAGSPSIFAGMALIRPILFLTAPLAMLAMLP